MTNLVTPIPDYLNISDWYELVEGDAIPNGWLTVVLYPDGDVRIIRETYGYQSVRSVKSSLKTGHRFFTRTPVPTAIKRAAQAGPRIEPVKNVYGPLTGDFIQDEQLMFDALALSIDKKNQTCYTGNYQIDQEPWALGRSPLVSTLVSIAEHSGIVFDYLYADGSENVFIIVYE